jgi:hypothetical protein
VAKPLRSYFNYTMKSGTTQLHGTAYDYFVNEALNTGLPFTDAGNTNAQKTGQHIRNPVRQNDFGFTLGGPVKIPKLYNGHDRTFFFFSFERRGAVRNQRDERNVRDSKPLPVRLDAVNKRDGRVRNSKGGSPEMRFSNFSLNIY